MQESSGLSYSQQFRYWLIAFFAFMAFLWLFSDILLPFLAGMALAYFLDPVADALERLGASRMVATVIIMVLFLFTFVLFLMIIVPVLGNQIAGFLERFPELVSQLQALIASNDSKWLRRFIDVEDPSLRENLNALLREGAGWISTVIEKLWASGKSLINVISLLVVTPVVAFYLLYDWDHMTERFDSWLPRDHRSTIHDLAVDIDKAVAGFVRGQGTVCIILGLFYAICLSLVGVNFGLLIGLFAGLISFIPFVGSIVGFILSVGVALVQFWPDYIPILMTAAIFGAGQFLEGNFLQPKLVGQQVGLHPVWLMFALFAFGSLFGFTGMLIAVPAAAAIGVLVRFGLGHYLESNLYKGTDSRGSASKAKRSKG